MTIDADTFLKVATGNTTAGKALGNDRYELTGKLEDFSEFMDFFMVGEENCIVQMEESFVSIQQLGKLCSIVGLESPSID